jgi:hypothetical protein
MKFWWVDTPRPGNFGDIITPFILDHFKISYEFDSENYEAISTGSIIKHAKPGTIVLGSGIMGLRDEVNPLADIRFVRGPITRNKILSCGGVCPPIYGDPAMLLPLIFPAGFDEPEIGIVPHFRDYELVKSLHPNYKIINLLDPDPSKVIKEITSCDRIISSSLHGIICAHAYGILAAWVKFSSNLKGDDIKFVDYFSSVGVKPELSTVEEPIFSLGKVDYNPILAQFLLLKRGIK